MIRSISTLIIAICFAAVVVAAPGRAVGADAPRVGFVDVERILVEAEYVRRTVRNAEGQLEVERVEERSAAIEKKVEAYAELMDELNRKRSVLTRAAREAMEDEGLGMIETIERERAELNASMRRVERDQMGPVLERLLEIVRVVGEEMQLDLVLLGEVVLFASDRVDITAKVIARLDADLPDEVDAPTGADDATSDDQPAPRAFSISDEETVEKPEPDPDPELEAEVEQELEPEPEPDLEPKPLGDE